MTAGKQAGLVDVKVVSFSETHTAEKFVIPVAKRRVRSSRTPSGALSSCLEGQLSCATRHEACEGSGRWPKSTTRY